MSATTSTTEELVHRADAIPELDRGRLSWPIALAAVAATTLVVLLPVGRAQLGATVWVWGAALAGVLGLNLLVRVDSWNGLVVKWVSLAGCIAFLVVFPLGRTNATLVDLGLFVVFAIVCIGLNLTHGFAGKISLAQAGFLGIGAYVSVLLDTGSDVAVGGFEATLPDLPFLLAIAVAGLTCMAFSVLIGFPALRVQGPWLAFVTLAFNLLVFLVLNNEVGLTEGSRGLRALRSDMEVFGVDLFETRNYYYFCLVFLLAAIVLVWWIVRSPWGRAFKALRDNPARAASLGVDIRTYTLLAFSIGAGLAGVAGALYARLIEYVEPRAFYIGQSFDFFLATVVGGLGTMIGPFIGTSFITVLTDHLRFTGDYYRVWFGLFVIVMMLVAPKGVAGTFNQLRSWLQRRRAHDARRRARGRVVTGEAVVRVTDVHKSFGGIKAVDDVSFEVRDGEILGVIGPNGCGKTTLFNCILGQYRPDRGRVELAGRDVSRWPPHRRANAGLARTFQLLQVFESMSVRDNLKTAAQEHIGSIGRRLFRTPDMGLGPKVDRLIERFRLGHLADEPAGNLSYGQQKLLDTAMAFVSDPAVVFLDEPAGGVNPTMLGEVRERIRDLNENDGTTFAVIEHNMEFVFGLAHRIVVMEQGRVLMTGTPDEVREDPRVLEVYLGG